MTHNPTFLTPILFFRYLFFTLSCFFFSITQSHFLFPNSGLIHISAAVSTKDALIEIQHAYQSHTGTTLVFNYGASGALVTQILAGAPCDVVLSADLEVLNRLQKAHQVEASHISPLLKNTLVIAMHASRSDKDLKPEDLKQANIRKIGLGKPGIVPAGTYAQKFLMKLGLWEELHKKIVFTPHVRAATTALRVGNVDAALVYKTDTLQDAQLKVVYEFPEDPSLAILYPLAVLNRGANQPKVQAFVEYLKGPEAGAIFAKHGFARP